jgi:hypothetical protein
VAGFDPARLLLIKDIPTYLQFSHTRTDSN